MANYSKLNPENVPGALFVDLSCIDCGTCYHLGQEIFHEHQGRSRVARQPADIKDWELSKAAILSCPTNSIGVHRPPADFKQAPNILPLKVSEKVYYCGFTSQDSYGASSYLLLRPEGNVLVDSPRFNHQLVKHLEALGGIKYMFLTHQDDVADHAQFAAHFNCQRILHQHEMNEGTREVEQVLDFEDCWTLAPDLLIIRTPGHTQGHCVLLFEECYLFTGDHLFVDHVSGKLEASRNVCWYSWTEQIKSMEKLLNYRFEWVMPGHGGWYHHGAERSEAELINLIKEMKKDERI